MRGSYNGGFFRTPVDVAKYEHLSNWKPPNKDQLENNDKIEKWLERQNSDI